MTEFHKWLRTHPYVSITFSSDVYFTDDTGIKICMEREGLRIVRILSDTSLCYYKGNLILQTLDEMYEELKAKLNNL